MLEFILSPKPPDMTCTQSPDTRAGVGFGAGVGAGTGTGWGEGFGAGVGADSGTGVGAEGDVQFAPLTNKSGIIVITRNNLFIAVLRFVLRTIQKYLFYTPSE